jgi:cytochrome c biogenesis protein CcdA
MIDPVAVSVQAVSSGSIARLPIVMLAGLLTSFGPCVAPRYVALAALLERGRRTRTTLTFVAGMLVAYAGLGLGAGLLGALTLHASALYIVLAAILIGTGLRVLIAEPKCAHAHDGQRARLSGAFSLGAASAFVVSPCCTPVVAAVLGMAAFEGNSWSRTSLLAGFALGHAAPVLAAAPGSSLLLRIGSRWNAGAAPALVSGTLMVALGLYYGLLV